jgi:hypothetical protein
VNELFTKEGDDLVWRSMRKVRDKLSTILQKINFDATDMTFDKNNGKGDNLVMRIRCTSKGEHGMIKLKKKAPIGNEGKDN